MTARYCYFLGLGSNLQPTSNLQTALHKLQAQFAQIILWPIIETEPVSIESQRIFLNTLVVVRSNWTPEQLKSWCNELEESLGRNRKDPLSSIKDRPLDIDILAQQSQLNLSVLECFTEPYVRQVIASAERATDQSPTTHPVSLWGHQLGQRAATVYPNHAGGHIMVVEDSVDRLFQCFEAPLDREQSLC
ncbi:2-amino-4-hydroxy-6-hydroxymethyldihydropteridine diphosphokinase [Aliidiomarina sedimenti]|uniref:2-amino-4-hydroxy-6-hydroxymethyldihydropteridine pyrophosphokinase n=1 Tax=Aliidiomarina sedimenti TaxID=1933879 RepID=A0ABY0BX44_9GAMM|nr:2-amino-4-hydroxy-6-hydroxymethyldihydropteridine diphosphokinase [Aliidiomarina sedimenti]